MSKYIDANRSGKVEALRETIELIDSLQQEQPEPYFYCKYGGTIPLCSDCKRNHNNSSFKTEEITTWYAPSNGTKHCIDYIQQEQPDNSSKEKALSLQIQAYLTTASDELYAPGKPLYTKEHHKDIHECMLMWQKLHQYYFSNQQDRSMRGKVSRFLNGELHIVARKDASGRSVWSAHWVDTEGKKTVLLRGRRRELTEYECLKRKAQLEDDKNKRNKRKRYGKESIGRGEGTLP